MLLIGYCHSVSHNVTKLIQGLIFVTAWPSHKPTSHSFYIAQIAAKNYIWDAIVVLNINTNICSKILRDGAKTAPSKYLIQGVVQHCRSYPIYQPLSIMKALTYSLYVVSTRASVHAQ